MKRIAVTLMLLLGLCACGGTSSSSSASSAAVTSPASLGSAATGKVGSTGTGTASPGTGSGVGSATPGASTAPAPATVTPTVAKEACQLLTMEAATLSTSKSVTKARTTFELAYSDWVGADFSHQLKSSDELDTIGLRTCPKPRTKLLKKLHGRSLGALLHG